MTLEEDLRTALGITDVENRVGTLESNQKTLRTSVEDKPSADEVRQMAREEAKKLMESSDGSGGNEEDGGSGGDDGTTEPPYSGPDWMGKVAGFYSSPPRNYYKEDATVVAKNKDQLLSAVENSGSVIEIPNDTTIDLTGVAGHDIADDVVIFSHRDIPNGKRGGILKADDYTKDSGKHVFYSHSDNIHIEGVRLKGPNTSYIDSYDESLVRAFGMFLGENLTVHNCELYGWPFTGTAHGANNYTPSHTMTYNHYHDNIMEGLGYGVELYNGHHTLKYNYFDRCRHAISAFGHDTNGYEAAYNVVGSEPLSHAFDMHALEESTSHSGDLAGGTINIHDNAFYFTHDITGRAQEAVAIRGVPDDRCDIDDNHFKHTTRPSGHGGQGAAYRQGRVDSWHNIYASGNTFGTDTSFEPPF